MFISKPFFYFGLEADYKLVKRTNKQKLKSHCRNKAKKKLSKVAQTIDKK
jgi:hypothetical protein